MIVYQIDGNGRYLGPIACDESPLEPGVFLIPFGTVNTPPPSTSGREFAVWSNGSWEIEIEPPEPEPEPDYVYNEKDIEANRQRAYRENSDPLFFKWQRGSATKQEWLDSVQEVKNAHPYPEGTPSFISEQGEV